MMGLRAHYPQNMAPLYIDHLKLRESEKLRGRKESLPSPFYLQQVIGPSVERRPPCPQREGAALLEEEQEV